MSAVVEALAAKQAAKLGIDIRDQSQRVQVEIVSRSMIAERGVVIPAGTSMMMLYPDDVAHLERLVDRMSDADVRAVDAELEVMAIAKDGPAPSREAAYARVMSARAARGEMPRDLPPITSIRVVQAPAAPAQKAKG